MSDEELDALLERANRAMLRHLDETTDTEARLAELMREALGSCDPYLEGSSLVREANDNERNPTMKTCDHKSVGVIITDPAGRFLLLTRAKPPAGRAPVAGHVDEHGEFLEAAIAEAREEVGVDIGRPKRVINEYCIGNICRRPPSRPVHDGHTWTIFQAQVTDTATSFDADETRGGDWYTPAQLQKLADRTVGWVLGWVGDADFAADPGLEPVWISWMSLLGYVKVSEADLNAVELFYSRPPAI